MLPMLKKPAEAVGHYLHVPGAFWDGCPASDKDKIFCCCLRMNVIITVIIILPVFIVLLFVLVVIAIIIVNLILILEASTPSL